MPFTGARHSLEVSLRVDARRVSTAAIHTGLRRVSVGSARVIAGYRTNDRCDDAGEVTTTDKVCYGAPAHKDASALHAQRVRGGGVVRPVTIGACDAAGVLDVTEGPGVIHVGRRRVIGGAVAGCLRNVTAAASLPVGRVLRARRLPSAACTSFVAARHASFSAIVRFRRAANSRTSAGRASATTSARPSAPCLRSSGVAGAAGSALATATTLASAAACATCGGVIVAR